jgi:small subunit ribosomal protein S16
MAVALRLARGGAKKRPYYRIVATDRRNPRDGRFIEKLGTYNPMLPKDSGNRVTLVEDRIKYWLSVGAQPSERVHGFLHKAGILEEAFDVSHRPQKSRKKEDKKTRQELKAEADAEAKAQAEEEAKAAAEAPAEEAPAEEPAAEAPAEEAAAEETKEA